MQHPATGFRILGETPGHLVGGIVEHVADIAALFTRRRIAQHEE